MRVVFIAPSAYLLGGVQDWLYSTVIGLRDRGHNIEVGVPDGEYHKGRTYNEAFEGLNASFFRNSSGTHEGRIRALVRYLEKRDTDLIVGVNIGSLFHAITRLREHRNTRFAMTVHALEANYFKDMREYRNIIDGLVTTNRLSMRMAKEMGGIEDSRLYYAPYGVPIEDKSKKQHNESERLRIVWVGRLDETQKRVMDLIDILKSLDAMAVDYHLSIAGDGPQKTELLKGLREWRDTNKVEFHGRLNKGELIQLYKENDILLLTSQWETGPIVAWEAVSAGCCIVSSRYIGSEAEKTLLDQETALLFEVGDTRSAAQKISTLRNKELRLKIQKNSRRLVTQRYSTSASLDAWENAFEQIIRSNIKAGDNSEEVSVDQAKTGKLEKYLGVGLSELLRTVMPKKNARDPGSEWPHSLQGINDQKCILEHAYKIETGH